MNGVLTLSELPKDSKTFNILRAPVAWGKTSLNPYRSFEIKQYTTFSEELAMKKWSKLSRMNAAVLMNGTTVEKSYGMESYVHELIGWFITERANITDLDELQMVEDLTKNCSESSKKLASDTSNDASN